MKHCVQNSFTSVRGLPVLLSGQERRLSPAPGPRLGEPQPIRSATPSCRSRSGSSIQGARLLFQCAAWLLVSASTIASNVWWPAAVEVALGRADTNRAALVAALEAVPTAQRPGMQFLVENMPDPDLRSLGTAYLVENVALAYEALSGAPWRAQISEDLFLNDILPYACVNERREAWRPVLREKALPLVQDCQTPGEAARRLNEKLFGLVNVRYSTQRRRADQGPLETMSSGLASCTGLSILLADACRAVGVPARVAGTPNWFDKRGNHTWVEVWDQDWHFVGAAEPDPAGLDRGWFVGDAARAQRDSPEHAIYASSFRRTPLSFPLVWARRIDWVYAVNVTDRYTTRAQPPDPNAARLRIKVVEAAGRPRVAANVTVTATDDAAIRFSGTSKDERFDLNDVLTFDVPRGRTYRIEATHDNRTGRRELRLEQADPPVLVIPLTERTEGPAEPTAGARSGPTPASPSLPPAESARAAEAFAAWAKAPAAEQARWSFDPEIEALLATHEAALRALAWDAYRQSPAHAALKEDFVRREVRFEQHVSPYTIKKVGEMPPGGWPLFIAMHGGGGAPQEVNDRQWRVMQNYYRDQAGVPGYLYLALRAPNNTWNGFYDVYVYPLVANLIRQWLLFGDVNPDKVFLMGYSHGGYGAFAIGPKMPDRFAAIHSSAAAPTDGETSAKTLRNTRFTFMIGENDHAYGRLERCRAFNDLVTRLRGDRTNIFPVTMEYQAGFGHSGLPDREKIKDLYDAVRNPVPCELSWEMTDTVVRDHFWLHVPEPGKGREVAATCEDNRIVLATTNVTRLSLRLDARLIDPARPLVIERNGQSQTHTVRPSLLTLCRTMAERGDPRLASTIDLEVVCAPSNAPAPSAAAGAP